MGSARRITGWICLIAPLCLLGFHLWVDLRGAFVSFAYYIVSWGSLLALTLCGFWFVLDGPGAKWMLRVAATVTALYIALMFLITLGHAGHHGSHDYLFYTAMVAGVAFCAFTFFVAGKHAT